MFDSFWRGLAIISLGGLFNGTFALPMKYTRRWRWENTWLTFAFLSLLIFPAVLSIAFVPHLPKVYSATPIHVLLCPLCFGFLLGIGQVAYGLGIASVGIATAVAVVSGVSCISGALIPLLVLHPENLLRPQGLLLIAGMPIIAVGLVFYGMAGHRRERERAKPETGVQTFPWGFKTGLAICLITGILGSSINIGFALSGSIVQDSLAQGASVSASTYPVWSLLFGASFFPNLIYCSYLLFRNRGWRLFVGAGFGRDAALATGMGLLSFAAFITYGIGAMVTGKYGTSIGWAVFVAATIVISTLSGLTAGEWKGSSRQTRRWLWMAVLAMLTSVCILNLGGLF